MKLSDFILKDAIIPQLQALDRNGVIEEIVATLVKAGAAPAAIRDELVKLVIDREKKGSTGFGKGVAVPHVKHDKIKRMAACIALSKQGVDFNALDKEPVFSVVFVLSPKDKPEEHLQAMEKVFSNLQDDKFRKFLRQAESVQDVLDLMGEADSHQLHR